MKDEDLRIPDISEFKKGFKYFIKNTYRFGTIDLSKDLNLVNHLQHILNMNGYGMEMVLMTFGTVHPLF